MKYPYVEEETWKFLVSEEIKKSSLKLRRRLTDDEKKLVVRGIKKDLKLSEMKDKEYYQMLRQQRSFTGYSKPNSFYYKTLNSYHGISNIYNDYKYFINTKFDVLAKELEIRNRQTIKNFMNLVDNKNDFEKLFLMITKKMANSKRNNLIQNYNEILSMNLDTFVFGIIYVISDSLVHFKLDEKKVVLYDNIIVVDRIKLALFADHQMEHDIFTFYDNLYQQKITNELSKESPTLNLNLIKDDDLIHYFLETQLEIKDKMIQRFDGEYIDLQNQLKDNNIFIDNKRLFDNQLTLIEQQFDSYKANSLYKMIEFKFDYSEFDTMVQNYVHEIICGNVNEHQHLIPISDENSNNSEELLEDTNSDLDQDMADHNNDEDHQIEENSTTETPFGFSSNNNNNLFSNSNFNSNSFSFNNSNNNLELDNDLDQDNESKPFGYRSNTRPFGQ